MLKEKQKQRTEILKKISILKSKIAKAQRQGKSTDELTGQLALLQSDLLTLSVRYQPPWVQKLNIIGGKTL